MQTLKEKRTQIDTINGQLMALLGQRLQIAREIAKIKKRGGLPILDETREDAIKEKVRKQAREQGLSAPVMEEIFQILLDYTRMEMEAVE